MITQRLMKPGSFRIELVNNYPHRVASAVELFDHIVITANRLRPITDFSDADVLANSIYTGVIVRKGSPRIFEGHDLHFWLGSPNDLGPLLDTAVARAAGTLTQWVNDLRPGSLAAGTVTNTSAHTGSYQWMMVRKALDAVCQATGSEYRVNPDGTLDAGAIGDLFVTTPTVVITRKEEGRDGTFQGLDGGLIVTAKDVQQYTTTAWVAGPGEGAGMLTDSASGSTSYKDLLNAAVEMDRLVNAPGVDASTIAALSAAMVAQFNVVRRELSLSSKTYTVSRFARPGDYVYVYDQLAELVDPANQIVYRGEVISPIAMRVYAQTWPPEKGVGVYARRSGAPPVYTDLTDFVQWESGDVTWDVGAAPLPMSDWVGSDSPLVVERALRP